MLPAKDAAAGGFSGKSGGTPPKKKAAASCKWKVGELDKTLPAVSLICQMSSFGRFPPKLQVIAFFCKVWTICARV